MILNPLVKIDKSMRNSFAIAKQVKPSPNLLIYEYLLTKPKIINAKDRSMYIMLIMKLLKSNSYCIVKFCVRITKKYIETISGYNSIPSSCSSTNPLNKSITAKTERRLITSIIAVAIIVTVKVISSVAIGEPTMFNIISQNIDTPYIVIDICLIILSLSSLIRGTIYARRKPNEIHNPFIR